MYFDISLIILSISLFINFKDVQNCTMTISQYSSDDFTDFQNFRKILNEWKGVHEILRNSGTSFKDIRTVVKKVKKSDIYDDDVYCFEHIVN